MHHTEIKDDRPGRLMLNDILDEMKIYIDERPSFKLLCEETNMAPGQLYTFRHNRTRDVCYGAMKKMCHTLKLKLVLIKNE